MKADDRLTRKTHLRPPHGAAAGKSAVVVYDLTKENEGHDRYMADVVPPENASRDSIVALPYAFSSEEDILTWSAALMADSPTASRLWIDAERQGWKVRVADLKNAGFHIDVVQHILTLDNYALTPSALGRSPYFRNALITAFIRALRDIWHEYRSGAFETAYCPEAALMLERVRAADCDTLTILAGWELRGAGYSDVWRHLIGSEEGDMALVFSQILERDPASLFDGSALSYAFRQWFADESRVDGCDHVTLEALDDILLDSDNSNPFGNARLHSRAVESLAWLPDGRCYLQGLGETIMRDPFFAGLHDPINQTHLFHLMYDMEAVIVNNVPFRDRKLARLIFPGADIARIKR